MKTYYMKRSKHVCSIPGCGARDTFMLTRSRNFTGCVFLCADCIARAMRGLSDKTDTKKAAEGALEAPVKAGADKQNADGRGADAAGKRK